MFQEALKIIAAIIVVGLISMLVTGAVIVLVLCLLACWAVWLVAEGLSGGR